MLIGIDANEANLTSQRVGVNQYAFNLLKSLYKTSPSEEFVIYLKSPPLPDLPKERQGWKYRVIPFPKLWTQTRLPFDLFFHNPRPDVFFSMTHYAPRWSPVPTVIAIMDLGFLDNPEQFDAKDYNQLKSWTRYSVLNAKKIIAISSYTKNHIVKAYGRNPEDIIVTSLSHDPQSFSPKHDPSVLRKYSISKPYFLYLGSLKPSKNINRIIEGFSLIASESRFKNHSLVIAGKKGWLYEDLFTQVESLNIGGRVRFTGFVDQPDVPYIMSSSEAFVMPSLHEGFGIPALEAMACGTPVVVSSVASLPEVVGDAGIIVNPNSVDSIAHGLVVASGKERSKFVKLGLKRVKSFSWDKAAKSTLLCLKTATANN